MNKPIAKIDINNVFFQLHEIASKQANSGKVEVTNLGVDPDKKTFSGPGEMLLIACAKESGDIDNNLKKDCLTALQTYVEFFASKDVSSKIKEDDLSPIESKLQKDKQDKNDKDGDKKNKKEGKTESIEWKKSLLVKLFEDADDSKDAEEKIIGYSLPYKMNIEGQKDIDLKFSMKKWAGKAGGFTADVIGGILKGTMSVGKGLLKGMFGGMLSDLASIKLHTFGNHSIGVKDIIDPALGLSKGIAKIFKGKVLPFLKDTFLDKDIKEVQQKLQARLSEKYPNTTAKVNIEKKNALLTELKASKKLDSDVKKNLSDTNLDQVLVVEVSSDDKNYGMFSVEAIAKHLAAVVGGMFGKLKLWDNDKDKAKVLNVLSKSYEISKVSDLSGSNSEISISKQQANKKESLSRIVSMMNLVFEGIDEQTIMQVFSEAKNDIIQEIASSLVDKENKLDKKLLDKFIKLVDDAYSKKEFTGADLYGKAAAKGIAKLNTDLKKAATYDDIVKQLEKVREDGLKKLVVVSRRINVDDQLEAKQKECENLFDKTVKGMQTKDSENISKQYLNDFIKRFEDYVSKNGEKTGAFRDSEGKLTVGYSTFMNRLKDLAEQENDISADDFKTAFKELVEVSIDKKNSKIKNSNKQLANLEQIADAIEHISLKVKPKNKDANTKDLYIITKPRSWYQGFEKEQKKEKDKDNKEENK